MKKMMMGLILSILTVGVAESATFIGVDVQDTNITSQSGALNVVSTNTVVSDGGGSLTIDGTVTANIASGGGALAVTSTDTVISNGAGGSAVNIQDGGNSITIDATQLDVDDLTFASDKVDASGSTLGANSGVDIGDVTLNNGAGAGAVNIQDGGNSLTVDGTVGANLNDGAGTAITSEAVGANRALHIKALGVPDLEGLVYTSTSAPNMIVTEVIGFTGLGSKVKLIAKNGSCTWELNGGPSIILFKNTADEVDMKMLQSNPSLELTATDGGATQCWAYMDGAG